MKWSVRFEELVFLAAICWLYFDVLELSTSLFFLLFLTPDVGMLGYLVNTRIGAITYNIFHHRAVMLIMIILGAILEQELFSTIGLIYLAHISFDRMLGYGLKYPDSFKHTHLGWIGGKVDDMDVTNPN